MKDENISTASVQKAMMVYESPKASIDLPSMGYSQEDCAQRDVSNSGRLEALAGNDARTDSIDLSNLQKLRMYVNRVNGQQRNIYGPDFREAKNQAAKPPLVPFVGEQKWPFKGDAPEDVYIYKDNLGNGLFLVGRFQYSDGSQKFRPAYYDGARWNLSEPDHPGSLRPLYGLDRLATDTKSPVLLVRSEKCTETARGAAPRHIVIAWGFGAHTWAKTDWIPLSGRQVIIWPDNDNHGQTEAMDIATRLAGLGGLVRLISVPPGKLAGWSITDAISESGERQTDVTGLIENAQEYRAGSGEKGYSQGEDLKESLRLVNLDGLGHIQYTPPRFIMERLIPAGVMSMLGAHGGIGKTVLGLSWAAHVACGRSWGGLAIEKGRALFVSLEDGEKEILYRLQEITRHFGLPDDEVKQNLDILYGSDVDAALVREDRASRDGSLVETLNFQTVKKWAQGCSLIVIDNASDAFDGNENIRREVKAFTRRLSQLGKIENAGVLLLAHVDKATARGNSQGNGYSGSTAWHNGARSRLVMERKNDVVILEQEKNNFGPKLLDAIHLAFTGVVLAPCDGTETTETAIRKDHEREILLNAIRDALEQGATLPESRSGSTNFYGTLTKYAKRLIGTMSKDATYVALSGLVKTGEVRVDEYKRDSKLRKRIVLGAARPPMSANQAMEAD